MLDENLFTGSICANCQGPGDHACQKCRLVVYCGDECQAEHWPIHREDCESPLLKESWRPTWMLEKRTPSFHNGPSLSPFGGNKYFWGNMPAIDILKLSSNEGMKWDRKMRLLFAASGDLRNVVKTIASVPTNYKKPVSVVVNDIDFDIVARNLIILLIAFVCPNRERAVECMLHLWYSALLRPSDVEILHQTINTLFDGIFEAASKEPLDTVLTKTWEFGRGSCRVDLTAENWLRLLLNLKLPEDITLARAREIRASVLLAEARRDHRERGMVTQPPAHRFGMTKFRKDGILLPVGHSRHDFTLPNPTLFQSGQWDMQDSSDPLDAWSVKDVNSGGYSDATNDLYGKLYSHVKRMLTSFYDRLAISTFNFEVLSVDVVELPDVLTEGNFSRIEVSNISDRGYVGMAHTAAYLGPLLQPTWQNPSATLLMLFMNAVYEITQDYPNEEMKMQEIDRAIERLGAHMEPVLPYDTLDVLIMSTSRLMRNGDHYFREYLLNVDAKGIEKDTGMKIKDRHTIVDRWPQRLKLRPGQTGAEEEFRILLGSGHSGSERYMEWQRPI